MEPCKGLITPSKMIADIVEANTNLRPQVISNGVDLHGFSPNSDDCNEAQVLCEK
jgi:hypothetical protein